MLFNSDVNQILDSLQKDFPEVVKIKSIGDTFEKRPIKIAEIDARDYILKKAFKNGSKEELTHWHEKPAILLTGQFHPRELITSSMVLYSMVKLIHGGLLHPRQNQNYVKMLE